MFTFVVDKLFRSTLQCPSINFIRVFIAAACGTADNFYRLLLVSLDGKIRTNPGNRDTDVVQTFNYFYVSMPFLEIQR